MRKNDVTISGRELTMLRNNANKAEARKLSQKEQGVLFDAVADKRDRLRNSKELCSADKQRLITRLNNLVDKIIEGQK